jgi:hypothetical protein
LPEQRGRVLPPGSTRPYAVSSLTSVVIAAAPSERMPDRLAQRNGRRASGQATSLCQDIEKRELVGSFSEPLSAPRNTIMPRGMALPMAGLLSPRSRPAGSCS